LKRVHFSRVAGRLRIASEVKLREAVFIIHRPVDYLGGSQSLTKLIGGPDSISEAPRK
jgi:hypothetical protein